MTNRPTCTSWARPGKQASSQPPDERNSF